MNTSAFPVTQPNVTATFEEFQAQAERVQSCCNVVSQSAGNVPAQALLNLLTECNALEGMVTALNANPALTASMLQYLPSVFPSLAGQTAAEIQASFGASVTALQALIAAVIADLPLGTGGYLLVMQLINGNPTMDSFPPAQLSHTLPAIATFMASLS